MSPGVSVRVSRGGSCVGLMRVKSREWFARFAGKASPVQQCQQNVQQSLVSHSELCESVVDAIHLYASRSRPRQLSLPLSRHFHAHSHGLRGRLRSI